MTKRIDPLPPVSGERRHVARRRRDRAPEGAPSLEQTPALPALIAQEKPEAAAPAIVPDPSPSAFVAQVIGQDGQKRGLRGGPPVLEQARLTYLETEWSGRVDRRPRSGQVTKTDI